MAVGLLHRRPRRRADVGEEQRRLDLRGEIAQVGVAPRRRDAPVAGRGCRRCRRGTSRGRSRPRWSSPRPWSSAGSDRSGCAGCGRAARRSAPAARNRRSSDTSASPSVVTAPCLCCRTAARQRCAASVGLREVLLLSFLAPRLANEQVDDRPHNRQDQNQGDPRDRGRARVVPADDVHDAQNPHQRDQAENTVIHSTDMTPPFSDMPILRRAGGGVNDADRSPSRDARTPASRLGRVLVADTASRSSRARTTF